MNLSKKTIQISLITVMSVLVPIFSAVGASPVGNEMRPPLDGVAPDKSVSYDFYLPYLEGDLTLSPPFPPPIPMSSTPPIDFDAIRDGLKSQGLDLAFNKIGFHVGYGGNLTGIGDWMADQDAAGVPFFLKSADVAGPLYEGQLLAQASGVPHTLVFRLSTAGQDDGYDYDVPNYDLPPTVAAAIHWQRHLDKFPPELDPSIVWIETINEVDKGESEWLGEFATATAELALADGYRWAAFGWSSGEPEPYHWESPEMIEFLTLASQHPDRLAVSLHEYSYSASNIGNQYPYLVGRFQSLFQACDERGILRPTVLITEWGWESTTVPDPAAAMTEIEWAAWLYAAYPQIRGAAIWYLGGGYNGIANEAQKLIAPLRDYSLSHYFAYTTGTAQIDPLIFSPPPNDRGDLHTVVFPVAEKADLSRRTRPTRGRGSPD
ncbi:MAG TPA: hypothetical protein VFI27_01000 [candidate division Zixibacteria bacterium]|nr:hypothetical protein [candidate division Zixibacteria bacterium]